MMLFNESTVEEMILLMEMGRRGELPMADQYTSHGTEISKDCEWDVRDREG